MKRFITVYYFDAWFVLQLIRNAVVKRVNGDLYEWLKHKLNDHHIEYTEEIAGHHSEIIHRGGYISYYLDPQGTWLKVGH